MKKKKFVTQKAKSFINAVTPDKCFLPLDELKDQFAEKSRQKGGYMPYGDTLHGVENIVELRIRAWLLREKGDHKNDLAKDTHKITPPKI